VPQQTAWSGPAKTFTALQAQTIVERLYRAILAREADPSGLSAYVPLVQSGELDQVVSALVTSGEFETLRAGLSAQAFAAELYWELLDREGDPGGLSATVTSILAKHAAERAAAMVLSDEYAQKNG